MLVMFVWVFISAVIQAFSFTSFAVPGNIYPGGVGGLVRIVSDVLLQFFNINFPYYILYVIINIILAIIVYRSIGKLFTIFSLIQIVLVSVFSSIFKEYPLFDDLMLLAIFGGLINGVAAGLALKCGASGGGTDFISIYYSNKYHKSMWNEVFGFNAVLIVVAGLLFGWERAAYSIIYQFVTNYVIKLMHKRYTHQAIFIVTDKEQEVISAVFKDVNHGITKIEAKGAYSDTDRSLLYTVVNSFETNEVVKDILLADPKAFLEVRDIEAIYGNYNQKPLD